MPFFAKIRENMKSAILRTCNVLINSKCQIPFSFVKVIFMFCLYFI